MSVLFPNNRRINNVGGTTPQVRSQRSNCNVVIYRWANADISKINLLEAQSEEGFAGRGDAPTEGNFATRSRVVIRNDVVRCNVSKSKGSPSGTFSIELKRGKIIQDNVIKNEDINYLDVINPGDWIFIYIKKSGKINVNSTKKDSGLKMVGIIENVRYTEIDDPATGKPQLRYIVTGQDFGKAMSNSLFFNPILNPETVNTFLGAKFLTDSIGSLKGAERNTETLDSLNPQNIIRKLLGFYLGKGQSDEGADLDQLNSTNQTWYVPPNMSARFGITKRDKNRGVSFSDILQTDRIGLQKYNTKGQLTSSGRLPGVAIVKSLPSSGTVWSVLDFMKNKTTNEMYTELQPDSNNNLRPSLVMRQVPFSNKTSHETCIFATNVAGKSLNRQINFDATLKDKDKTFFVDLPRINIVSSDIKQKNVGKSDHERINHLLVVPQIDFNSINIAFVSAVNTASIQRYGLKSFQTQSNYVLKSEFGDLKKTCKAYLELLIDWFFLGHLLFNGTIVIEGQDEHIPVGDNLYITDIQQLYHVESVTHTFQILSNNGGTEYTTSLSVSRGQSYDGKRAKFIGPSAIFKEPSTVTTSVLEGIR